MNKEIKTVISGWMPMGEIIEDTMPWGLQDMIEDRFCGILYLTKKEAKEDGVIKPIYRRFKVTMNIEVEDFEKKPLKSKKRHDH